MQSTAAELWRSWERSGTLRPQDYDSDVADHVRRTLARQGHDGVDRIDRALDDAGWTTRDLLHTLAPLVTSFAGMQRDLLRLLQRVGAASGTQENLRVQYEFVEGDIIDESLADFRERVSRIESVIVQLRPLSFSTSHAFHSPLRQHSTSEAMDELVTISGSTSWETWRFLEGVPDPAPTGNLQVDARAERVIILVRRVLERLDSVGVDTLAAREWMGAHHHEREQDPALAQVISAAIDFWPLSTAAAVYRWTSGIIAGTIAASDEFLAELDAWLDRFEEGEAEEEVTERTVQDFLDILALPSWGKRHELYSAWITTQLDLAVDARLEFVVTDGALRFPFHATLLAHLPTAHGSVELWCEVRSPATGELHGGRRRGIQPDYRFQRAADEISDRTTVAAVEAKQYKSPAATKHGGTLRDYVANLPGATVLLVAHGPLGVDVIDAVPESDHDRVRVHPDVRVGRPRESARFRADIARLFPPPATRPTRIELRWSPTVADLDLHVHDGNEETSYGSPVTAHSTLRSDERNGGPEVVDIRPDSDGALGVRVHVYSSGTLRDAAPVVTFFRGTDPVLSLTPTDEFTQGGERWWSVARIDNAGRMTASAQSRQTRHGDGPP